MNCEREYRESAGIACQPSAYADAEDDLGCWPALRAMFPPSLSNY
jgi:hypothetical protein